MNTTHPPHAVSRLRTARLARSTRPFLARGGPHGERCGGCRLILSHCICALRPVVPTRAGVCLIMAEHEALKPSNTGWLIADVVPDTMAFGWARTEVDPACWRCWQIRNGNRMWCFPVNLWRQSG
jgi:DTW domain-containing protein YfiP